MLRCGVTNAVLNFAGNVAYSKDRLASLVIACANVYLQAMTLGLHVMHRTQFSVVYSSVCVSVSSDILLTLTDESAVLLRAATERVPVVVR